MKTAICLSGQPREVNETWQSFIDNLYSVLPDPDIFIYTSEPYPLVFQQPVSPKIYVVEPQTQFLDLESKINSVGYYNSQHTNSYLQQMYGLKRVWALKCQYEQMYNFQYDLVVRTRPDFLWIRPLPVSKLDLTKLNCLHSLVTTEFTIGPNNNDLALYFNIFDWLQGECCQYLTPDNPRLYVDGYNCGYSCDNIMSTYLIDQNGVELATVPYDHPGPYAYYRIMYRQLENLYGDI